jgi:drug/metabolite transporter (DMT)-like permease
MRLKADLLLFLTSLIWGSAFSAQRVAAQFVGPFLFNGARFLLAGLALLLIFRRLPWKAERRQWLWMAAAGVFLFLASTLQQAGLHWTTAANAGFITTLYVVIVPLVLLALGEKVTWQVWLGAALATGGAKLLSSPGTLHLAPGDGLELLGAVMWAFHIVLISRIVHHVDAMQFAIGQYLVCGALNLGVGLIADQQTIGGLFPAWWAIAYTGFFSVALGYTIQVIAQRFAPPGDAALIMGTEAIFAALFGYLTLGEGLTAIQIFGGGLILAAVVLVQWQRQNAAVPVSEKTTKPGL